jgi:large subunit ribosomal protein L30e
MPISFVDLERQLKAAVRTGKVTVGRKEVANSLKATKLLVWSASANLPEDLLKQTRSLQIPAIRFDGNPIELGKIAGIPYKVSVLAVKSGGDAKLDPFSQSQDYSLHRGPSFMPAPEEPEVTEEAPEEKPAKKAETKRKARKKEEEGEQAPKTRAKRAKKEDSEEKSKSKSEKAEKPKAEKKASAKPKKATKKKQEDSEEEEEE